MKKKDDKTKHEGVVKSTSSKKTMLFFYACYFFGVTLTTKRACLFDNLNPDFCFALYLTGVHFQDELQHVGDVSQQKIKYRPIWNREIGDATLPDVLYEKDSY